MEIEKKLVKNFGTGRGNFRPIGIVIHIGEGTLGQSKNPEELGMIYSTFQSEPRSSHYCIADDGRIVQFVEEKDTAWAQGRVVRPTAKILKEYPDINPNMFLFSIENEGVGEIDITPQQYQANANLVRDICVRWNIPIDRIHIIGHREIRADKTCPGRIDLDKIVDMARLKKEPEQAQLSKTQRMVEALSQMLRALLFNKFNK